MSYPQREINCLLLAEAGKGIVILLRLEAWRFHTNGISARLELGEIEPAVGVGCGATLETGLMVCERHGRAGNSRTGGIRHLPHNSTRGLSLGPACGRAEEVRAGQQKT